ncbi:MAG: hypothetical protein ABI651_01165 [Verrucomicrobiota bacterium]
MKVAWLRLKRRNYDRLALVVEVIKAMVGEPTAGTEQRRIMRYILFSGVAM